MSPSNLTFSIEKLELLLFECMIFFGLHLSIAKFPFYEINKNDFLVKDYILNKYPDVKYYRVNNSSEINSEIIKQSGATWNVINNIPLIKGYDVLSGYWVFNAQRTMDLKKFANEEIFLKFYEK